MSEFKSPTDIANRALQHLGAVMLDQTLGLSENSDRALHIKFAYPKLRRAELRRNVWRFATRRAAMRPIDRNTMALAATLWVQTATYFVGQIVADANGTLWSSRIPNNLGSDPTNSPFAWEQYFGPLTVSLYDSTQAYFAGELVYTSAGDGTSNVFASRVSGYPVHPALPDQWNVQTVYSKGHVVQEFAAWSAVTTYAAGATVTYTDGLTYTSAVAGNLNHIPPSSSAQWVLTPTLVLKTPLAPQTSFSQPSSTPVGEWSVSANYVAGNFVMFNSTEYVAIAASTGQFPNTAGSTFWAPLSGGALYMSTIDLNYGADPSTTSVASWSSLVSYGLGMKATGSDGVVYTSLAGGNLAHDPTTDGGINWLSSGRLNPWTTVFTQGSGSSLWTQIGGAAFPVGVSLSEINIVYPLGSGPTWDSASRNIYRLPSGFLKRAVEDPTAGVIPWLGAPSGPWPNDWVFEGDYLVTSEATPVMLRFVADVSDVLAMDDMFCEGLGARIAYEICEPITQSTAKQQACLVAYKEFMGEARSSNAIEIGSEEPEEDEYLVVRY